MSINFKTAYGEHTEIPSFNDEPSRVKQSFAKECNINTIVAKARKRQAIPINSETPMFGDFTKAQDFQEMQNQIINARMQFEALDSRIRERFRNDPLELLKFMEDPQNHEEAIKLGLLEIIKQPEPDQATKYLQQIAEQGAAAIDAKNGSEEPKKGKK